MSKSWRSTLYPLLITSLAWSTGELWSTACAKGVGERCQLRIWADCPRTAPQNLPETGFSKKLVVCVFTPSEHYDTICKEVVLLKRVQEISLPWSTGETRVSWSSPGGDVSKSTGSAPLNPSKNLPHVEHRRDKGVMEQAWGRCEQILGKRSPDPFCAPLYFVLRAPRYSVLRTSHLMFTLCLWLKPTLGGITQTAYF